LFLSGFVLTYQYGSDPNYDYKKFLTLRFTRLYIPYIASIMLCIVLMLFCNPQSTSGLLVTSIWKQPYSAKDIFEHLLMIGNFNTDVFNSVIWSLVHEMRVSILFPLILFITRLNLNKALVVMFLVYVISIALHIYGINASAGFCNSYLYTVIYLYTFLSGSLIAQHQNRLIGLYNRFAVHQKWLFIVTALLMYNYAHLAAQIVKKLGFSAVYITFTNNFITEIFVALASMSFIIAALANRDQKTFLTGKILLFLGKISYSLYLVHLPVGAFIFYTLTGKLPILIVGITAVCISLLVAAIFNKLIEKPAMRIGKKLISV
jgi:peptidoglycan/LPS O-acetylase OafA/YrhL